MKRKIKLKQVIILLLLVFMCAFALSNYKNYKLLKNGYSINEVKEINKNLISDDIKSLIKRNYTKDVIRIIESKKFKPTNFNNYLKLLDELGNYNDKIIVEENSYFPIGQYSYTHFKIITIYKGINDPEKIKEEKGKIVLKEFE